MACGRRAGRLRRRRRSVGTQRRGGRTAATVATGTAVAAAARLRAAAEPQEGLLLAVHRLCTRRRQRHTRPGLVLPAALLHDLELKQLMAAELCLTAALVLEHLLARLLHRTLQIAVVLAETRFLGPARPKRGLHLILLEQGTLRAFLLLERERLAQRTLQLLVVVSRALGRRRRRRLLGRAVRVRECAAHQRATAAVA